MAKPLSEKSKIIRAAISKHPHLGNTEIAQTLNDAADRLDDKLTFKATDVAAQRQAMKKAPAGSAQPAASAKPSAQAEKPKGNGRRKPGRKKAAAAPKLAAPAAASASPVDLIDKTLDLAAQAGGVEQLKKLVDRLADMRRW